MNFQSLIGLAKETHKEKKNVPIKGFSTTITPNKKPPRSNVPSAAVQAFLAKQEQQVREKDVQARKDREKLLALRAQNTKSNKAAKLMASRTKENDFSRIKISEEELEAKLRREAQIRRQVCSDKVERMKARIKLEEFEAQLPHKRKRKPKPHDPIEKELSPSPSPPPSPVSRPLPNGVKKTKYPTQPSMSFADLIRLAAEKKNEDPDEEREDDDYERTPQSRPMTKQEILEEQVRKYNSSGRAPSQKGSSRIPENRSAPRSSDSRSVGSTLDSRNVNRNVDNKVVRKPSTSRTDERSVRPAPSTQKHVDNKSSRVEGRSGERMPENKSVHRNVESKNVRNEDKSVDRASENRNIHRKMEDNKSVRNEGKNVDRNTDNKNVSRNIEGKGARYDGQSVDRISENRNVHRKVENSRGDSKALVAKGQTRTSDIRVSDGSKPRVSSLNNGNTSGARNDRHVESQYSRKPNSNESQGREQHYESSGMRNENNRQSVDSAYSRKPHLNESQSSERQNRPVSKQQSSRQQAETPYSKKPSLNENFDNERHYKAPAMKRESERPHDATPNKKPRLNDSLNSDRQNRPPLKQQSAFKSSVPTKNPRLDLQPREQIKPPPVARQDHTKGRPTPSNIDRGPVKSSTQSKDRISSNRPNPNTSNETLKNKRPESSNNILKSSNNLKNVPAKHPDVKKQVSHRNVSLNDNWLNEDSDSRNKALLDQSRKKIAEGKNSSSNDRFNSNNVSQRPPPASEQRKPNPRPNQGMQERKQEKTQPDRKNSLDNRHQQVTQRSSQQERHSGERRPEQNLNRPKKPEPKFDPARDNKYRKQEQRLNDSQRSENRPVMQAKRSLEPEREIKGEARGGYSSGSSHNQGRGPSGLTGSRRPLDAPLSSKSMARHPTRPPPKMISRPKLPPITRNPYLKSDSEDEYDDEEDDEEDDMSDFIDDGPLTEEADYSSHIRAIFGYDKRKYRFEDDKDEAMESSYAEQMKEEARSRRIGRLEDQEEERKELEAKLRISKRKSLPKKRT